MYDLSLGYDPALMAMQMGYAPNQLGAALVHHPHHPVHHAHHAQHAMQPHHMAAPYSGAEIARFAQHSLARMQPVQQIQVLPLNSVSTIAAGASGQGQNLPQRTFQCRRFAWGSTSSGFWTVQNLVFGVDSMFAATGDVEAEVFAQTAVGLELYGFIAVAGITVTISATNTDNAAHRLLATIVGPTVV